MKSISYVLVLVSALGLGCAPEIAFPVTIEASTVIEDGGLVGDVLGQIDFSGLGNIDFDASQEFENNNVRKENIRSLRLSQITLEISAPEGADFNFLETIAFSASAPGNDTLQVASGTPGNGINAFELVVDDVELAPYATSERFSIITEGAGAPPPQDTTVEIGVRFDVVAGL